MLRPLPLRFSLAAIVLLGIVLVSLVVARQPDNTLRIIQPAIKGDGVLVFTPQGHTILIDGGADGTTLATWLGKRLPFGQRHIDVLILTRPDGHTLPGQLAAIRRYSIGTAFVVATKQQNNDLVAWREMLREQGTSVQELVQGRQIRFGNCDMNVLTVVKDHATLALHCGQTSAYFLQSIDNSAENSLASETLPRATLVVYPWDRATRNPLLEHLQPAVIAFSEGGKNKVQQSFAQRQIGTARLLHKDLDGEITLVSDGLQVRVSTEKETR